MAVSILFPSRQFNIDGPDPWRAPWAFWPLCAISLACAVKPHAPNAEPKHTFEFGLGNQGIRFLASCPYIWKKRPTCATHSFFKDVFKVQTSFHHWIVSLKKSSAIVRGPGPDGPMGPTYNIDVRLVCLVLSIVCCPVCVYVLRDASRVSPGTWSESGTTTKSMQLYIYIVPQRVVIVLDVVALILGDWVSIPHYGCSFH